MSNPTRPSLLRGRRRVVALAALTAVAGLLLSGCAAGTGSAGSAVKAATCKTTTKSSILLSTPVLDVSYIPYGIAAKELGYFSDECIDMTVNTTGDGAIQSLLNNKADFAMSDPAGALTAANGKPMGAKVVYNLIPNLNIFLATTKGSKINDPGDLKGAKIGISGSSPFYDAYVQQALKPYGLTLKDVTLVATGYGSTPTQALKSGTVDAVLYWPGLYTTWKLAGTDVKLLKGAKFGANYDGIGLLARDDTIKDDPKLVTSTSRALAKSIIYLKKYPESAIKDFWKAYPSQAPLPGADQTKAMSDAKAILKSTLETMGAYSHPATYDWGTQSEARWTAQIKYMTTGGILPATFTANPDDFFTSKFIAKANDFDHSSITEQK